MAVRYRAKSDNYWAAVGAGAANSWIHIDAGMTGRVTVKPVTDSNGNVTKPIIIQNNVINTSGASGAYVITDSTQGIMAQLKASVAEKDYHYTAAARGSIYLDNNGSDATFIFTRD